MIDEYVMKSWKDHEPNCTKTKNCPGTKFEVCPGRIRLSPELAKKYNKEFEYLWEVK